VILVRVAYLGMLIAAMIGAVMGAVMLLVSPYEGDRPAAWFWGTLFATSSLVAAWTFWELWGGDV
jgi:energy-converting hydrogenase Eha subunit A